MKGKTSYYVVAYFFPRGNQPGEFAQNVLPKGSVSNKPFNVISIETVGRVGEKWLGLHFASSSALSLLFSVSQVDGKIYLSLILHTSM